MSDNPRDIPLYHITHIDNLTGILASGALWCDRERMLQGFQQVNIAYTSLKERRMGTSVPVFPGKNSVTSCRFILPTVHRCFTRSIPTAWKGIPAGNLQLSIW